jgi:hypothetical protein
MKYFGLSAGYESRGNPFSSDIDPEIVDVLTGGALDGVTVIGGSCTGAVEVPL